MSHSTLDGDYGDDDYGGYGSEDEVPQPKLKKEKSKKKSNLIVINVLESKP